MKPLKNKIMLEIEDLKFGVVASDSIAEVGTIVDIGPEVDSKIFKIGKKLYFKAWAVDIISKDDKKLYFISSDSDAICALE